LWLCSNKNSFLGAKFVFSVAQNITYFFQKL
jgi:hypothetical protein